MTQDRNRASAIARAYGIPLDREFHSLNNGTVCAILDAADGWHYRKPRNANGSRARYFYAYLQRLAGKEESDSCLQS